MAWGSHLPQDPGISDLGGGWPGFGFCASKKVTDPQLQRKGHKSGQTASWTYKSPLQSPCLSDDPWYAIKPRFNNCKPLRGLRGFALALLKQAQTHIHTICLGQRIHVNGLPSEVGNRQAGLFYGPVHACSKGGDHVLFQPSFERLISRDGSWREGSSWKVSGGSLRYGSVSHSMSGNCFGSVVSLQAVRGCWVCFSVCVLHANKKF